MTFDAKSAGIMSVREMMYWSAMSEVMSEVDGTRWWDAGQLRGTQSGALVDN